MTRPETLQAIAALPVSIKRIIDRRIDRFVAHREELAIVSCGFLLVIALTSMVAITGGG
jgi:hypothetical protein